MLTVSYNYFKAINTCKCMTFLIMFFFNGIAYHFNLENMYHKPINAPNIYIIYTPFNFLPCDLLGSLNDRASSLPS